MVCVHLPFTLSPLNGENEASLNLCLHPQIMSVVDGALDEFLREQVQGGGESGRRSNGTEARGEDETSAPRRQWSDQEWQEWNSRWRWSGWGTTTTPEGGNSSASVAAAGVANGGETTEHSQAVNWDPWSSSSTWNGGWNSWRGQGWQWDRWQGSSSSKGDYADPPSWGGWANYRLWRRALSRWNSNTDVAQWRRSEKVLRQFDWDLQSKFEHLTEEQLSGPQYLEHLFKVLDTLAGEKENSERRRAVRAALYEGARKNEESLSQYSLRRESQFSKAGSYIDIPNEIKAFLLEEQAGLSAQGKQNLRTMTGGEVDFERVKKALVALDVDEEPIVKSNPGKSAQYFQHSGEAADQQGDDVESESASDDECILFAMQAQELDEDAAMSFLTAWNGEQKRSWSQNKAFKLARRKDRRHFEDKGSRPERPRGRRRLSVSELKKITRCRRCQQLGHWEEDCKNEPKPRNYSGGNQPKNGGNGFAYLGFGASSSSTSLSSFIANILEQSNGKRGSENFLAVPGGFAIIDPGASQDLVGLSAFRALESQLAKNGLKTIRLNTTPAPANGVGGSASPLFEALSPCILGGEPGVVKLTVLKEDIPQLLSVGLLEYAGAVIDTCSNKISFKRFGKTSDMIRMESGHRIMPIYEWDGQEFPVPELLQSEYGLKPGDFNLRKSCAAYECGRETETNVKPNLYSFWDSLGNFVMFCFGSSSFLSPVGMSQHHSKYPYRSTWLVEDLMPCLEDMSLHCVQVENSEKWYHCIEPVSDRFLNFKTLSLTCFSCEPFCNQPSADPPSNLLSDWINPLRECILDHVGQQGSAANEKRAAAGRSGESLVSVNPQAAVEASGAFLNEGPQPEDCGSSSTSSLNGSVKHRLPSPDRIRGEGRQSIRIMGKMSDVSNETELYPLVQVEHAEEEGFKQKPCGDLCAHSRDDAFAGQGQGCSGTTTSHPSGSIAPRLGTSYECADSSNDRGDHQLPLSSFGPDFSRTTPPASAMAQQTGLNPNLYGDQTMENGAGMMQPGHP